MERINISYHGREIDKENKATIKANIALHMRDAPSDATACCCISSEEEGFACNLKIHSAKGHVSIHRESRDLKQLFKFVYDSMDQSFKKWHEDPDHFAKSHPMDKTPCRTASHKNLKCPMHSLSHSE